MKYKLFITDYDGTLGASPNNDIDPQTLDAINRFTEKGGIFSICTGREYRSIRKICLEQNLEGLVVCFQGASINDIQTGETILSGGISEKQAIEVVDEVKPYGLTAIAYTLDGFYLEEENEYTSLYQNAVAMKGIVTDNIKERIREQGSVYKLGWLGDDGVVNMVADKLNAKYKGEKIKFNSGAKFLLEAINPAYSKGNAVRFLAKHYNISLNEVLTVGDSTNDIDLIKGEWHGVAVGDAKEQLKAVAKEITLPFKDKPIKHLLEKYCL